ncbi:hypothetical protein MUN89_19595 [Halobacillus salinarum]|uniref:Spore germination protein gerPA/gerPF n=1 Tax=Halobacillus salinarum TaxID=2932257 RepID=A0ABY4EKH7_9BACI|nr:hypothetical protein [Halobacillus salinarum]UOQ44042.1 hypothetical protein MUN89_19595 [Halobacillus salinarum]
MFAPSVVNILGFKVNVLDRSSTIAFAGLQQTDFFLSTKRNMGFGEQNGDLACVNVPINFVADPDVLDSNSTKGSVV